MLKTLQLLLLLSLSFVVFAQNGPTFTCPSSPDVYLDENGKFTVPDLTTGLSSNGGNGNVTFSQVPAPGTVRTYIHDVNHPNLQVEITATDNQEIKNTCNLKLKIKDTIPPEIRTISVIATVAFGYCSATISNVFSYETDNSGVAFLTNPQRGQGITFEKGKTEYTVRATVSDPFGNTTSREVGVGITYFNQLYPPFAQLVPTWAADKTIECGESTEPSNTGMTTAYSTSGCTPEVTYTDVSSKGIHPTTPDYYNYTIKRTWTVTPMFGDPVSQEQVITVRTGTPPRISDIITSKTTLWPANHQMHDIALNYTVSGGCGGVTTMVTVSSSEPENGTGDSYTAPDWEVLNNKLVRLRAERSGNGKGRYYTITVTTTDMAGKSTSQTAVVEVPKNKADQKDAINSKKTSAIQIQATPNPSSNFFTVNINSSNKKEKITVTISNAMGRIIEVRTVSAGQTVQIGSSYQGGIYYVEASQGGEKSSTKLIKSQQ